MVLRTHEGLLQIAKSNFNFGDLVQNIGIVYLTTCYVEHIRGTISSKNRIRGTKRKGMCRGLAPSTFIQKKKERACLNRGAK